MESTKDPQELLERAQHLQTEFWDAVAALEAALGGVEISTALDLSNFTLEDVRNGIQ